MKLGHWQVGKAAGGASGTGAPPLFSAAKAHTSAEGAKNGYIFLVAATVPFVLAVILGLGVGYFFAGFQGFTWSVPGVMAYGGGFAVEAVCLACFFAAAKAFWGGARWHFGQRWWEHSCSRPFRLRRRCCICNWAP